MLVASSASAALAVSSYTAVRAYRERAFVDRASFQAATTAALLRRDVEPGDVEERLAAFGETLTADLVAVHGGEELSSTPLLSEELVPARLRDDQQLDGEAAETTIGGTDYRVVGMTAPRSGTRLYFFFARTELDRSLRELATILAVAWVAVTVVSAGVGTLVARRTLRPVRTAADAAHAVAEGLLDTRLPVSGADEFATLAGAFNEMAQALQAKLAEVTAAHQRERRFTGDVAHELMTPLGALVTEASLLESHLDDMPPRARRMTELVVHDVRRLRALVEELLELARLDAVTASDRREPFSGGDLLRGVTSALAAEDIVDITGDVDEIITADRACVDRIVSNLVRNAIVHGGHTPVSLHVKAAPETVTLTVRDRGPGIPPEHLPHVFQRFYKADGSRSSQGSGLGLAIAAEYARLIGAALTATNVPDGGAEFTLILPQEPAEQPAHAREPSPAVQRGVASVRHR